MTGLYNSNMFSPRNVCVVKKKRDHSSKCDIYVHIIGEMFMHMSAYYRQTFINPYSRRVIQHSGASFMKDK